MPHVTTPDVHKKLKQVKDRKSNAALHEGDHVRLLSKPTGYTSSELPLTIGNTYIVRYLDGSNVCTSTDQPGLDGHYSRSRVEKVISKKT